MKTKLFVSIFALTLLVCAPATAQSPSDAAQHFAKDGLSFDYPAGWTLTDKSDQDAQHLLLTREGSTALITVVVQRKFVASSEELAAARNTITLPYAQDMARKLGVAAASLGKSSQCLGVASRAAMGYRLEGALDGQPATGEIYTVMIGRRVVNVVNFRKAQEEVGAAPAWMSVLNTIKIETPPEASGLPELKVVVSGGVLNGKAVRKPAPEYPADAKAARAQGTVVVQITIDETGKVIFAKAVSGHALLRDASVQAALRARFTPTILCGLPVKVSGVVTYNFVLM
jgi:TonB family protein